jgi:hypothetical protein
MSLTALSTAQNIWRQMAGSYWVIDWKECSRKGSWLKERHWPYICLDRLRKDKRISHDNWPPRWELKPGPPKSQYLTISVITLCVLAIYCSAISHTSLYFLERLWAEYPGNQSLTPSRRKRFYHLLASIPAVGFIQPLIEWVTEVPPAGIK